MESELSRRPATPRRNRARAALARIGPGLALCALGVGMWVLARGQPAWSGGHVGPGLMAQLVSMGVIGLGAAWAAICACRPGPEASFAGCCGDTGGPVPGLRHSAPALLGAVLAFALSLPLVGLVGAAGLAAGLAAWGAGERSPRALVATIAGLMALVALVGAMLLPPTAALWPDV